MTGELTAVLERLDREDPMTLLRELVDEHDALKIGPLWQEYVYCVNLLAAVRGTRPRPAWAQYGESVTEQRAAAREEQSELRATLGAVLGSFRPKGNGRRRSNEMHAQVSNARFEQWRSVLNASFVPAVRR